MTHASLSEQFKADHGPGEAGKTAPLTASRWPVVLDLPPELKANWPAYLPSKLSLALHMIGHVPFDDSDSPELARGKRLESVGVDILRERGFKIIDTQQRIVHRRMNALTTLDVVAVPHGAHVREDLDQWQIVEFKVVDERDYRREWEDGPPLYPLLQVAAQQSVSGIKRAQIGAIVLGYKSVDLILHPVERNEELIAALEHKGQAFLDLIARETPQRLAELLIEEDSPDSLGAWSRIISLPDGTTAEFLDPEAVKRAQELYQAQLDGLKAEKTAKAAKNWLAVHCPQDAARIKLLNGWTVNRSMVKGGPVPAFIRRPSIKWDVKPSDEDEKDE